MDWSTAFCVIGVSVCITCLVGFFADYKIKQTQERTFIKRVSSAWNQYSFERDGKQILNGDSLPRFIEHALSLKVD